MRETYIQHAPTTVPVFRSGLRLVAPLMTTPNVAYKKRQQESIMLNKRRIAVAMTLAALAAVSAVDSASAGFNAFFGRAVTFYYIPY
jgi:hypothetical protein